MVGRGWKSINIYIFVFKSNNNRFTLPLLRVVIYEGHYQSHFKELKNLQNRVQTFKMQK